MTEEETQGDAPEQPEESAVEEAPEPEAAAEETPAAEEPEAAAEEAPAAEEAEAAAEEPEAAVEEAPAAEEAATEPEEAPAEEPAAEAEEAPAEEAPAAETSPEPPSSSSSPAAPGADLEPIAIEPKANLSAEEEARLEAEREEREEREAALAGDSEEDELIATSRTPAQLEAGARYLATGKRKRSIARVTLMPGNGTFVINDRKIEEFFPRPLHQTIAKQPLSAAGYEETVDVRVRVHGGGISGQAGAVRHGIARALTEVDPELRGELKRRGFLTRDARVKERRKAGLKKARKRPQFSKR